MPSFINTDQGACSMSQELKEFLHSTNIPTSPTRAYNPPGNGQIGRQNEINQKTIELILRTKDLKISQWESVLEETLHSIMPLLCTSTNTRPHERMFDHNRKSSNGHSLPSWLMTPGPVLMKRNVRHNKYEPLLDEVELLEGYSDYSYAKLPDGREITISNKHLI